MAIRHWLGSNTAKVDFNSLAWKFHVRGLLQRRSVNIFGGAALCVAALNWFVPPRNRVLRFRLALSPSDERHLVRDFLTLTFPRPDQPPGRGFVLWPVLIPKPSAKRTRPTKPFCRPDEASRKQTSALIPSRSKDGMRSCCPSFSTRFTASSFGPPSPGFQAREQSYDRDRHGSGGIFQYQRVSGSCIRRL